MLIAPPMRRSAGQSMRSNVTLSMRLRMLRSAPPSTMSSMRLSMRMSAAQSMRPCVNLQLNHLMVDNNNNNNNLCTTAE